MTHGSGATAFAILYGLSLWKPEAFEGKIFNTKILRFMTIFFALVGI
jgi:hypothetical protein